MKSLYQIPISGARSEDFDAAVDRDAHFLYVPADKYHRPARGDDRHTVIGTDPPHPSPARGMGAGASPGRRMNDRPCAGCGDGVQFDMLASPAGIQSILTEGISGA